MSRFARSMLISEASVASARVQNNEDNSGCGKNVSDPYRALPGRSLVNATNCEELHLSGRGIEILQNFESFKNLESLWLNNNKIKNIKHLDHCFGLKTLRLHNNKIASLKGCLKTPKFLRELSLANNKIRDLESTLGYLEHLAYLEQLDLSGNPLCEELNYRLRVINAISSLKILDNHEIKAEEYKSAKALGPRKKSRMHQRSPQAPHLPFQRSQSKKEPFKSNQRPLFHDLRKGALTLERRDAWFQAAKDGNAQLMQDMLQFNINVNSQHPKSDLPALHIATDCGSTQCVKFLLDAKASVNITGPKKNSAVHIAAKTNRLEILKLLINAKAVLNLRNETTKKETPLEIATRKQHRDIRVCIAKALGIILRQQDGPPFYKFSTNTFWEDEKISAEVRARFKEYEEGGTVDASELAHLMDSLMLRVKPSQESIESIVNGCGDTDAKITLPDLLKNLKKVERMKSRYNVRNLCYQLMNNIFFILESGEFRQNGSQLA